MVYNQIVPDDAGFYGAIKSQQSNLLAEHLLILGTQCSIWRIYICELIHTNMQMFLQ